MLISPLKKRPYLSKFYLALFIVLSIMLRFNSGFLELLDTIWAIFAQEIARYLSFLAGPTELLGSLWFIWLLHIVWILFIRSLGFKVGSWWAITMATFFFVGTVIWSIFVFLNWNNGLTIEQTMPNLSLAMWSLLFFEIDNILIRRLHWSSGVKTTLTVVLALIWVLIAGDKMVETDLSFTTAAGAILLSYVYFRLSARLYLRHAKTWLTIFSVDGQL